MERDDNEGKYVSFKWLIVTSLSVIAICVTITIFTFAIISSSLGTKVDASSIKGLGSDIDELKRVNVKTSTDISDIKVSVGKMEVILQRIEKK